MDCFTMLTRIFLFVLLMSFLSGTQGNHHVIQKFSLHLPAGAEAVIDSIDTTFSCDGLPYGYYADVHNDCKIYHVCHPRINNSGDRAAITRHFSFICPKKTIFDQRLMVCAHSFMALPCRLAPAYYGLNRQFETLKQTTTEASTNRAKNANVKNKLQSATNFPRTENSSNDNNPEPILGNSNGGSNEPFFPTELYEENLKLDEPSLNIGVINRNYDQKRSFKLSPTDQTNRGDSILASSLDYAKETHYKLPLIHETLDEVESHTVPSENVNQITTEEWFTNVVSGSGQSFSSLEQYSSDDVFNSMLSERYATKEVTDITEEINTNKETPFTTPSTNIDISIHNGSEANLYNDETTNFDEKFAITLIDNFTMVEKNESSTEVKQPPANKDSDNIFTSSIYSTTNGSISNPQTDKTDVNPNSTKDLLMLRQELRNKLVLATMARELTNESWENYTVADDIDTYEKSVLQEMNNAENISRKDSFLFENDSKEFSTSTTGNISFDHFSISPYHSENNSSSNSSAAERIMQDGSMSSLLESHSHGEERLFGTLPTQNFSAVEQSLNATSINSQDQTENSRNIPDVSLGTTKPKVHNSQTPMSTTREETSDTLPNVSLVAKKSVSTVSLPNSNISEELPSTELINPIVTDELDMLTTSDNVAGYEDTTMTSENDSKLSSEISWQHLTKTNFVTTQSSSVETAYYAPTGEQYTDATQSVETVLNAEKTLLKNKSNVELLQEEADRSNSELPITEHETSKSQQEVSIRNEYNSSKNQFITAKVQFFEAASTIQPQEGLKLPYPYRVIYAAFPSLIYYPVQEEDSTRFEAINPESIGSANIIFPSHVIYPLYQKDGFVYPVTPSKQTSS